MPELNSPVRSAPGEPARADQSVRERVLVLVPVLPLRGAEAAAGPAAGTSSHPGEADSGRRRAQRASVSAHSPQDRLAESSGLAEAIDLDVVSALVVPVPNPRPGTLFGS
ncbi:MAG TPA: hypothetical protein P5114_14170, partial [Hyphomicrobiaceae bacterium]|nr:hypothetical protein [Hyphomicrobiaceae bacterium]